MNIAQHILVLAIGVYRGVLSPAKAAFFGPMGRCRFEPSCSCYALEAVRRHGAWAGSVLALGRLCRCHPWGGCGPDPVPEQFQFRVPNFRSLLSRWTHRNAFHHGS